ncbi:hypothetical protein X777_13216 [Ooceraea biroi]|uniref:Uncharacterized protein n=1 Tax=Ooceraea biroi TaxID=2015173 RepID=A0A026VYL4_OOCBI|nr:hypothetical protein X777_13216 [Ooceraea biroi]
MHTRGRASHMPQGETPDFGWDQKPAIVRYEWLSRRTFPYPRLADAGAESPDERGGCIVQQRRAREFGIDGPVAFTCIFHLSYRGVTLPGSTYNPPSNQRTPSNDVTGSRRLPLAASYRRGREPATVAAVVFYYFTYLPYERRRDGDGGGGDACAPFPYTRPGGRSPRSYLRHENATPTIFLLFRRRRCHRAPRLLGEDSG